MFGSSQYGTFLYGSFLTSWVLLDGASSATSNVAGALSVETELQGSLAATSETLAAPLVVVTQLVGVSVATSSLTGAIEVVKELYALTGQLAAISSTSGALSVETPLAGSVVAVSVVVGSINRLRQLSGSLTAFSGAAGALSVDTPLTGSVVAVSIVSGLVRISPRVTEFYETVANQITAYFQDLADDNSYVVRYDNELRDTPTDSIWCQVLVDFGEAKQHELGSTDKFRVIGNVSIRIRDDIGEGIGGQLQVADTIVESFRSSNVGRINFGVPRVANVGRLSDNNLVNVTCPFFVGKPLD